MESDLIILYQDDHFIAINKPAGIFVHRTKLAFQEKSCMQILRNQLNLWVYPVHRLDRATSGALLFALNPKAASKISNLFQQRKVNKKYIAVVRGFTEKTEVLNYPIRNDKNKNPVEAITYYKLKSTIELKHPVGRYQTARYSLVEIKPETGRRHQIRKHFARISHPIIGDVSYGDGAHNHFFRDHFGLNRLMLFAISVGFEHPYSKKSISIRAKLPTDINELLKLFQYES